MLVKTNIKKRPKQALQKLAAVRPLGKYVLRLYVAGATDRSRQAVQRVQQLCETELKGHCKLDVVDIYQQPELARLNQIVATPTLVIDFPKPMRRFIGNLSDTIGLFFKLDLIAKNKLTV